MSQVAVASSAPAAATPTANKALRIALWVVQVVLALMFGLGGFTKATAPFAELSAQMPWAAVMGEGMTRFIGISEFAGALGLILPALTRIRPILTPLAAVGLVVVMVLAAGYHVIHAEFAVIAVNVVIGALAAFVAWGRFRKAPIAPRA